MSRYYKHDFTPIGATRNEFAPKNARRGLIPHPETPEEKMVRLRTGGYFASPIDSESQREKSEFANYDFGNKELPAYKHKKEMIDTINDNRISMLVGQTGSGKTTQLGQFALEDGYRIVYLVPRKVIVDNVGERIEEELAGHLGEERAQEVVGLAHSERNTINDDSMVQVMTSGTFTKKLPDLAERWKGDRVLVVADEIHEGNLETEFASALAVRQVERDNEWRVVFASATPDSSTLTKTYHAVNGKDIPIVEIKGRPHELDIVEDGKKDIVGAYREHNAGVQKTLMFVDGKNSIKETIAELKKTMSKDELEYTKFFKLHANISERAKKAIFDMSLKPGEKAVIVSTSAGQSGITIPGVGLVITSGLTKSPELDDENASGLPLRHCTKAEIIQQAGRAGRDIAGGKCVLARPVGFDKMRNYGNPLYEEVPLDERSPHIPPEIYHSNISRNILAATAMGEDFFEFNNYLQHSVTELTIHEAYEVLHNLGAVDDDNRITDLGLVMDIFPLRPELARATAEVIHSKSLPIQVHTLAIAAAVEAGGLVDFDEGNKNWRDFTRVSTNDDFILQSDLMIATRQHYYGSHVDEEKLEEMGLNFKAVYRAHRQFDKMCRLIGLDSRDVDIEHPTEDEEDEIRRLFLLGMPDLLYKKVATERGEGVYANIWGYDEAINRKISNRSLIGKMGGVAAKVVAGYPRWYDSRNGEHHDIIEFGFPTSADQVRNVLGHLAARDLVSTVRNGQLVKSGHLALGTLELGDVHAFQAKATTAAERKQLVDEVMIAKPNAVSTLRDLGVDDKTIRKACEQSAYGATSVSEIDASLWQVVAQYQNPSE